jgi:hypothetical protein
MEGDELCVISDKNRLSCEPNPKDKKLKIKITEGSYFSITFDELPRAIDELDFMYRKIKTNRGVKTH